MIESLRQLQKLDLDLDQLKDEAGLGSSSLEKIQRDFEVKKKNYETLSLEIQTLKTDKSNQEEFLSLEEVRLRKSRTRLNEIKSNFEYQTLRREIESTERNNYTLVEQIKEKVTILTAKEGLLVSKKGELDEACQLFETLKLEVDTKNANFSGSVQDKEMKRSELEKAVEKSMLNKYTAIRKRHRKAVVEVLKGVCQGCNMGIPPQMSNLMGRGESFQCPHCSRFLFLHAKEGIS